MITPETEDAARRVAGATIEAGSLVPFVTAQALQWVMKGKARRAVVIGRPPGHHNGCDERLEVHSFFFFSVFFFLFYLYIYIIIYIYLKQKINLPNAFRINTEGS